MQPGMGPVLQPEPRAPKRPGSRRSFQTIQGRVTSCTEGGEARLTAERLDLLRTTVLAVADQRVELSMGVAEVLAPLIGTGETCAVYADGELLAGFSPRTRGAQAEALALPPTKQWR